MIPGLRIEETRRRVEDCKAKRYLLMEKMDDLPYLKANENLIESELEFLESIRLPRPIKKPSTPDGSRGGSAAVSVT
jgi:hypothetical protein